MSLDAILTRWKADPSIAPNITAWERLPARVASWADLPRSLHPRLIAQLKDQEIHSLYEHQLKAWNAIQSGKNIVLSTGTASGKSLAYQLPILNTILQEPQARALMLFPTKALARDQLAWLRKMPFSNAFPYDGDTPQQQRAVIRRSGRIIASNPDMLHIGILPYHTHWDDFFSNLRYVVIDEIHTYRGVFGSHVANLLRRLARIAAHYGSDPRFILTSATIGNPRQLAETLTGAQFDLISEDCSSRGEKHFLIYNPPLLDPKLGLRASMTGECIRLAADLVSGGLQTIIFGRSRRTVEFLLTELLGKVNLPRPALQSYRSGYLPEQRRSIEAGLRSGEIRGISATTALELGIDIGGLDSAILAGYPGSIAGSWQQAGRAGRTEAPSLAVLVASSAPLDQYLALHPQYLFSANPENGLIDPDNLLLLLSHLQCAAYELPFDETGHFGSLSSSETREILNVIKQLGKLYESKGKYYWMSDEYPAAAISLRSASVDQIQLFLHSNDGKPLPLGTVDYESALWMVHPGAIYLHSGELYRVDELDLEGRKAIMHAVPEDYYTEAEKHTSFQLLEMQGETAVAGGTTHFGDILVRSQVIGFKKIAWGGFEVLGREALEMPATDLNTMGFWITISSSAETKLREIGLWSSSKNDYGPDWPSIREAVLLRDHHHCVNCGKSGSEEPLHVHHKQPLRSFRSHQEANLLANLVTLCSSCHQRAESSVRVQSGIRGLGYILHSLAPLLLMCDPGDLGLYTDFQSPLGNSRPIALLYEHVPAGIGFSRHLYRHYTDLLEMALEAVSSCECQNGCPSCVGPGGENGSGGKQETLALLNVLSHDKTD